jgi:hypothetical protein
MPYATSRPCCDADSHIMETRDWIAKFTDPQIRPKLPEMSLLKSGTKSFDIINEAVLKQKQRSALGHRAVKFTPFAGEDVARLIRDAGAELFMFSSDYPHPEGTDDPIGRFERSFEGISEEAKTKFYSENFQALMSTAP